MLVAYPIELGSANKFTALGLIQSLFHKAVFALPGVEAVAQDPVDDLLGALTTLGSERCGFLSQFGGYGGVFTHPSKIAQ